jgi:hypothetical protein
MKYRKLEKFCVSSLALAVLVVVVFTSARLDAADFCLPGTDKITQVAPPPAADRNALADGDAFAFFDANPNMRGFLSEEATGHDKTVSYKDIVLVVPHVLSNISDNVRHQKITSTVSTIAVSNIRQVGGPEFYQCQSGTPLAECNRPKTDVGQFISVAAGLPASSFFVLASDLSIDGHLLLDNKPNSIKNSLEAIMQSGRAVGVLGFKVPFAGTIYGLPSGKPYTDAHLRPVFLLAVGARDKVLRFHQLLKDEFGTRWSDEDHNFLIFTNQLIQKSLVGDNWPENAFKPNKGVRAGKLWDQVNGFQQFTMSKKNEGAYAKINVTDIQTPHSLPIEKFEVANKLWQWRKENEDCQKSWLELKRKEKMIDVIRKNEQFVFKLGGPNSVVRRLPKRRKYYIRTEVRATDIGVDESLASWVSNWSFDERSEDALFNDQARLFPALNLRRFVSQLESVTRDAFKSETIAHFDLGVYLER